MHCFIILSVSYVSSLYQYWMLVIFKLRYSGIITFVIICYYYHTRPLLYKNTYPWHAYKNIIYEAKTLTTMYVFCLEMII
jgi:hypothetical protein